VSLAAGAGDDVTRLEIAWVSDSVGSGWQLGSWRADLQFEANLGYWIPDADREAGERIVDIGLTPVFRLGRDHASARFFIEGGIGAHLLSDTSPYAGRAFSTAFQFGDLIGVGWRWGHDRRHEVSLRLEHFSNASIKQPNQGIEFVQLRFVRRFGGGQLT
jgi:hypothetical protein